MEVVLLENAAEVGAYAAQRILEEMRAGTLSVLGVATGSSPLPVYQTLARENDQRLKGLTCFALDEYVGLPYTHPQSYHAVIDREVTRPLGLDPSKVHVPDGSATDLLGACVTFEDNIRRAGGIDVQILGIGRNGHIGFNEPTSSLRSRTRVKTLAPRSRADNARFFDSLENVPTHCVTQGLGTILDAKRVLLVAHGTAKAAAIAAAVEGPVTSMCPASALQLHRDATVVVDRAAGAHLQMADYYKFVRTNKSHIASDTGRPTIRR